MERAMIVILPTSTGFLVGTVPLKKARTVKSLRRAPKASGAALSNHLAQIRRWMRLSRRHDRN
jgi:hypothetical protein